jgi:hypothetical protein
VVWCLEIHDLVLSKLVDGRERDWDYAAEALKTGLVQPEVLLEHVPDLPVPAQLRTHVERVLRGLVRATRPQADEFGEKCHPRDFRSSPLP